MILKQKDPLTYQVEQLEQAVRNVGPGRERQRLEKDLAQLRAGAKGEQEAAYHIDFYFKESLNWAVIHDLRLEWNGRVAQIDHLIINRLLEIYVVESKSFRTKVRYANGGWERLNFNHWEGIPSPVEQNERHILVLKELIAGDHLAPTRLGLVLEPTFFNYVVVQPSCSIVGAYPKNVNIHRMDELVRVVRDNEPSALRLMKVIASETLMSFANRLVACHRPAPKVETAHPKPDQRQSALGATAAIPCEGCRGPVRSDEAKYCLERKDRFAGKVLCRRCQKLAPESVPVVNVAAKVDKPSAQCEEYGCGVDAKVLFFCRINAQRFDKRILCRTCQEMVRALPKTVNG